MEISRTGFGSLLSLALLAIVAPPPAAAQTATATNAPAPEARRDGQHDFDFEIGTWRTQLKRLVDPLSGSKTWVEYEGTTVVGKILGGRANLVELDVQGPSGRIEGLSLRLYNPETRQWSLNFSNIKTGTLSPPSIGSFSNGRGEFYSKETLDGREILVRFVISDITADSCHFEQAYSADGGKTWEVNWIADDRREAGNRESGTENRESRTLPPFSNIRQSH